MSKTIANLRQDIQSTTKQVEELNKRPTQEQFDKGKTELQRQLDTAKNFNSLAETTIVQYEQQIKGLQDDKAELEHQIAGLQATINTRAETAATHERELEYRNQFIDDLDQQKSGLEQEKKDFESQIESLQIYKKDNVELKQQLSILQSEISKYKTKLEAKNRTILRTNISRRNSVSEFPKLHKLSLPLSIEISMIKTFGNVPKTKPQPDLLIT